MVLALGICLLAAGVAVRPGDDDRRSGDSVHRTGALDRASASGPRAFSRGIRRAGSAGQSPLWRRLGAVEQLQAGMPGYRVQLPVMMHPVSAGVKGGMLGGLVMPVPALIWGLVSGHGIWYPVNLLAGMALPGVARMSIAQLEQFHLSLLIAAAFIHVATSLVAGLLYGVLLPTLPFIPKPMAWSGLLMPLLWTGVSFLGTQIVSPIMSKELDWPSFIFSQFIFGIVVAIVVMRSARLPHAVAGAIAGVGGRDVDADPGRDLGLGQRPRHLVSGESAWRRWCCRGWANCRLPNCSNIMPIGWPPRW